MCKKYFNLILNKQKLITKINFSAKRDQGGGAVILMHLHQLHLISVFMSRGWKPGKDTYDEMTANL